MTTVPSSALLPNEETSLSAKQVYPLFRRRYHFAAAHRLHNASLSDAENKQLYEQCNHLNGHGHNYQVDVLLSGPLDPNTQMLIDLVKLDALVQAHLLDEVDHRFLDKDVVFLEGEVSTVETLAQVFYKQLIQHIPKPAYLVGIRVYETQNNVAQYTPNGLLKLPL
jgi:6-pyruvoyltetrahydropterin/6-carboxytetrahydropterin synthase